MEKIHAYIVVRTNLELCHSFEKRMEDVNTAFTSKRQQLTLSSVKKKNVDQSISQTKVRQMIISTVLKEYMHMTLKCPDSCCSR